MGKLIEQHWKEIPKHFPFIKLGNFVAMPDHIQGILIIDHPNDVGMIKQKAVLQALKTLCFTKIFQGYAGGIRVGVHLKYGNYMQILHGNPFFMIILFAIPYHFNVFKNT